MMKEIGHHSIYIGIGTCVYMLPIFVTRVSLVFKITPCNVDKIEKQKLVHVSL